ncbi:MAG: hypothetical protein IKE56_03865, partial [Lachnospiraceae bacterium]|nr:hypothetical protein [Lachnospiraceae bacterium]
LFWYVLAFTVSLGVTGLTPERRLPCITGLGRRTLQIYILHRPIRDLMEYFGFYRVIDANHKLHVIFVLFLSVMLTLILGSRYLEGPFAKLRSVFDPLLEKYGGLW